MAALDGRQVLVRGPDDLAEEVELVQETIEDIARLVDEELEALDEATVLNDPFVGSPRDVYSGEYGDSRRFESEFEREDGGLSGGDMTSVLKMQPFVDEHSHTPVVYVTDRPLFAKDRETGKEKFVYGVAQSGSRISAAVLSSFAFQEMRPELRDEMLRTLTYHEGGHLLASEENDRDYLDEEDFGGGHCQYPDVMTNHGIMDNTRYRHENDVYCGECTTEIREGIRELGN